MIAILRIALVVLACGFGFTARAGAQAPAAAAPAPTTEELALPELLESRPRSQIESDIAEFRAKRKNADESYLAARALELKAERNIERNKLEIEALKLRREAAKKAKQEVEAKDIEALIKKRELIRKFQEKMRDARHIEVEYQETTRDYAVAALKACEIEMRYVDRVSAGLANPRMFQGTRDLEAQALKALQDRANAMTKLAQKEQELASKKKQVLESWEKLLK